MKKFVLISLCLAVSLSVFSQDKFRADYNLIAVYEPKTDSWGEWIEVDHTFVINVNSNGDIVHYLPNGESIKYRNVSRVKEGNIPKTKERYQIIKVLTDKGDPIELQLFDDSSIGLKLIFGENMIQFAKSN